MARDLDPHGSDSGGDDRHSGTGGASLVGARPASCSPLSAASSPLPHRPPPSARGCCGVGRVGRPRKTDGPNGPAAPHSRPTRSAGPRSIHTPESRRISEEGSLTDWLDWIRGIGRYNARMREKDLMHLRENDVYVAATESGAITLTTTFGSEWRCLPDTVDPRGPKGK